jgi:hypothetical protein
MIFSQQCSNNEMIFLTESNARQVNSILGSNSLSEVKKDREGQAGRDHETNITYRTVSKCWRVALSSAQLLTSVEQHIRGS